MKKQSAKESLFNFLTRLSLRKRPMIKPLKSGFLTLWSRVRPQGLAAGDFDLFQVLSEMNFCGRSENWAVLLISFSENILNASLHSSYNCYSFSSPYVGLIRSSGKTSSNKALSFSILFSHLIAGEEGRRCEWQTLEFSFWVKRCKHGLRVSQAFVEQCVQ